MPGVFEKLLNFLDERVPDLVLRGSWIGVLRGARSHGLSRGTPLGGVRPSAWRGQTEFQVNLNWADPEVLRGPCGLTPRSLT